MRNLLIGIVAGVVIGIAVGTTAIAPRLQSRALVAHESVRLEMPPVPPPPATPPEPAPETVTVAAPPASPPPGSPEAQVSWRMASAFGSAMPHLGKMAKRVQDNIRQISDGSFEITFHEPGALVPPLEMLDAVRSGAIEAAYSSPAFWADKFPALQLFATIPFGPRAKEYLGWLYEGGGYEIFQDVYRKNGLHGLVCGFAAQGAAGWLRRPINSLKDFNGLTLRATGLAAKVLERLGAVTTVLAGGDMRIAFDKGMIDGGTFSQPAADMALGLERSAGHYYFPGWQQSSAVFGLMINLESWNALPPVQRARLETVCGDNVRYGLAKGEASQFAALKQMTALGVEIEQLPPTVISALRNAWAEVATEESSKDRQFARAWTSLNRFREEYSIWSELSEPQP